MKLAEVAVKRRITMIMLMLVIILMGGVSVMRISIDLLPDIEIPYSIVMTSYSGVGPQEMEKLVTDPIEGAVATVGNIKEVTSQSSEGVSIVIAEFKYGTDMDFASLQMREKVDQVKSSLPSDANDPMVMKLDLGMMPVVIMTVSGHDADLARLQTIAEDDFKPMLERVGGVASVSVIGGYEEQVEIKTYLERMNGYGLSISYLAQIIGAENLNLPGGEVEKGNQKLTIRSTGEFQSIEEIRDLLIPLPTGGQIQLRDIADVNIGYKDITSITKADGEQTVAVSVQKQSGTNTVEIVDDVLAAAVAFSQQNQDLKIETVMDQSTSIRDSINTVKNELLMGGLLAVVVVFLFFHNIRTTLITATAIPIAAMATFAVLYFTGYTLNMMTLGGLTLAIGRLIDDNVVVLENIYRHRQEGFSRKEAAIKGASEVTMAVFASTMVTVAVFLPMVFVEGMVAILFKALAMTFAVAMLASLVVSLTLVPTLSSILVNAEVIPEGRRGLRGLIDSLNRRIDRILAGIDKAYRKILHYALHHRKTVVLTAIAVFLLSASSAFTLGAEFMPTSDSGQLTVNATLPDGARIEETDDIVSQIERKLEEIPELESAFTQVGSMGGISLGGDSPNTGSISIQLIDLKERSRGVVEVADEIRTLTQDIPGAEIAVSVTDNMSMGSSSTPIDIEIKGDELEDLREISLDIEAIVATVEGTREVKSDMNEGIPEVVVKINRANAAQFGLTAAQISQAVRGTIYGTTATQYRYEGTEIDVVISGDETFKMSVDNLGQTPISTAAGFTVPLNQVADIGIERGPVTISRTGQVRVAHVTSQIMDRDVSSIATDIEAKLSAYSMPEGYTYELVGEDQETMESFQQLGLALVLAVILVYMILAAQFESLLHPFTIILSLPMGFSGGLLGLFITRQNLSVPAIIGMILLIGIAVSNAIVLVDYIIKRRERGEGREEAIENAGPIRLRPILMTTIATILGMLPMALGMGEGSEMMAPMGIVVIFGLALSTLSTLLLVPVIYTIFEDIRYFRKNKREKQLQAQDIKSPT